MYLTQTHFNKSIAIAFGVHILLLIVYAIHTQLDHIKVLQKPIIVKLGTAPNASKGRSNISRETEKTSPRPIMKSTVKQPLEPIPIPSFNDLNPIKTVTEPIVQVIEKIKTLLPSPAKIEKKQEEPKKEKISPKPQSKPKAPPMVQHFRKKEMTKNPAPVQAATQEIPFVQHLQSKKYEVEGVSGHKLGNRTKADQKVITRYEQKLALWLQKHHLYPMAARQKGLEGDAIVRIQIDRLGNIRFYELAEPTPYRLLDQAVIKMIERSDPVPPVPDDYPGEYVLEFLVPVNFKLH